MHGWCVGHPLAYHVEHDRGVLPAAERDGRPLGVRQPLIEDPPRPIEPAPDLCRPRMDLRDAVAGHGISASTARISSARALRWSAYAVPIGRFTAAPPVRTRLSISIHESKLTATSPCPTA